WSKRPVAFPAKVAAMTSSAAALSRQPKRFIKRSPCSIHYHKSAADWGTEGSDPSSPLKNLGKKPRNHAIVIGGNPHANSHYRYPCVGIRNRRSSRGCA